MPWRLTQFLIFFSFSTTLFSQTIHIIQTTDIHSAIFDQEGHGGGSWLRLSSEIKKLRAQHGKNNTLLIDCGDTIQGSLSGYLSQGEAAIDMLNHLNYDAWVPGNHELDFGSQRFMDLCKKVKVPTLSANFRFTNNKAPTFLPWKIYKRAGKKICVIGMQASFLAHWSFGSQYEDCEVQPAFDTLKELLPSIMKQDPDFIILAMHHGLSSNDKRGVNEALKISRHFPEINLILGGHTHRTMPGLTTNTEVYYVQAGQHAEQLAHIKLDFKASRPQIFSQLISIDETSAIDPEAYQIMLPWSKKLDSFRKQELCTLDSPLKSGRPGFNCRITPLFGEAIRHVTGSDIALHGRLSRHSLAGTLNEVDLFKICPYENTLFTAVVTLSELQTIVEEQLTQIKSYSFNAPYGFTVKLSPKYKILDIDIPPALKHKKSFRLAFNSRLAADGGGRFPIFKQIISQKKAQLKEHPIHTRDALRTYLKSKKLKSFQASLIILK